MKAYTKIFVLLSSAIVLFASCKKNQLANEAAGETQTQNASKRTATLFSGTFVHPGVVHNSQDLLNIKTKALGNVEPWKSGYTVFKASTFSQLGYKPRVPDPAANGIVERAIGGVWISNVGQINDGANAAYQQAMMWVITGTRAYGDTAKKAIALWSDPVNGLKDFTNNDAKLMAGVTGFKFAAAAELLKHTGYPGWTSSFETEVETMFRNKFYNEIKDWAPANPGNWDAVNIKCMMAMAVFLDDVAMFNKAVNHFYNKEPGFVDASTGYTSPYCSNGCLEGYIKFASGQTQESGRDQGHVQFGLGSLAEACEVGLNQGMDMYGYLDNRLLKGFEYTASYLLGNAPSSYVNYINVRGTNTYSTSISPENRDLIYPTYEMITNHYARRKGLISGSSGSPVYYSTQLAIQGRPELRDTYSGNIGFGTLLFSTPTYYPGNLIANGSFTTNASSWTGNGCAITASGGTLQVTGRTQDYNGPRQNILTALQSGTGGKGIYDLTAFMKKIPAGAGTYVGKVTVKITAGGVTQFFSVKENFNHDTYALVSGSVNLQWSGTLTAAEFYVETDGSFRDFSLDKCSMVRTN
ncbi:alginate lyase family protein [Mucilaginibacter terrae]|uniref:alginate lyase family protein n=1 Tax=Mucilaginibacter terrae TaxID=1955052 RepID=UPI00363D4E8A